MGIEHWMPVLATKMGELPDLVAGSGYIAVYYSDPGESQGSGLPGTLQSFPCMVIECVRGSLGIGGPNVTLHQVRATIYLATQILPAVHNMALAYIPLVRAKVAANLQLGGLAWSGGAVDHCDFSSQTENHYDGPGGVTYADKPHTGIIFNLEVKEYESFILSA